MIRAPLPAVADEAVVEYQIVKRDTTPLFAAGAVRELTIGGGLPVERFHVCINAAKGVLLHTGSSLIPASAITLTQSRSGIHVEAEVGRTEPEKDFEPSIPPEQPGYPSFRFSTGTSWQQVASVYQQMVSQQIAGGNIPALLTDMGHR